jgi:hypothetical protein
MLFALILIFLTANVAAQGQPNAWKGIVPLKSTREDVEKILGPPITRSYQKHSGSYSTESGRVFVLFSTGPCSTKPNRGWDVPELTVISVSVTPQPEPDFDESQLDLKVFEKRPDPEILSLVAYTNSRDGVSISVNSWSKVVEAYHYFPEEEFDHLKCTAPSAENRPETTGP